MKRLVQFCCFLLAITLYSSCKKESIHKTTEAGLTGNWELRKTSGMLTTSYPAGNGTVYIFTDTSYQFYSQGVLVKSGQYRIINDNSVSSELGLVIPAGQYTRRIIFDNDSQSQKIFFQLQADSLSFVSGYFPLDGGAFRIFKKQ
jgi:hypothetical protein